MSNSSIKSLGGGVAGLGITLIFIGVVLYMFPQRTTTWYGATYTEYPYQDIGLMFFMMGIITTIIGSIIYAVGTAIKEQTPSNQPQITLNLQTPLVGDSASFQTIYCESCGREIPIDSIICPYCGTHRGDNSG